MEKAKLDKDNVRPEEKEYNCCDRVEENLLEKIREKSADTFFGAGLTLILISVGLLCFSLSKHIPTYNCLDRILEASNSLTIDSTVSNLKKNMKCLDNVKVDRQSTGYEKLVTSLNYLEDRQTRKLGKELLPKRISTSISDSIVLINRESLGNSPARFWALRFLLLGFSLKGIAFIILIYIKLD